MTACIIMHNMIVEDEGDSAANVDFIGTTGPPEVCNNIPEVRNEWLNNHIRSEFPLNLTHVPHQRSLSPYISTLYSGSPYIKPLYPTTPIFYTFIIN
jgi:hypothetical protein